MDVIVTFDLDHISCNNKFYETSNVSFDYKDTLLHLYEYFDKKGIRDFTAFVRIDNQVKNLFGDHLHVFNLLPPTPDIGWHPHCCRNNLPEYDTDQIIREMWQVYISTHVVRECKVFRMGGAVMDGKILDALEKMGFLIDSSAMPGCQRDDAHRKYDWSITGNNNYVPGVEDHRCSGTPQRKIVEVPMTTIPIPAPYDKSVKRRYINPTIRKEIFQPAFAACCHFLPHLVVTFHPDQLMDGYEDDLYIYGISNFVDNMNFIHAELDDVNYKSLSRFI
jgi:hypothetical protein